MFLYGYASCEAIVRRIFKENIHCTIATSSPDSTRSSDLYSTVLEELSTQRRLAVTHILSCRQTIPLNRGTQSPSSNSSAPPGELSGASTESTEDNNPSGRGDILTNISTQLISPVSINSSVLSSNKRTDVWRPWWTNTLFRSLESFICKYFCPLKELHIFVRKWNILQWLESIIHK